MNGLTCKGSYALGTACGKCSRCFNDLNNPKNKKTCDVGEIEGSCQNALMKYDPSTGEDKPYPSHAQQYREYHGPRAWLYNPWVGVKRNPLDIGTDVFGVGIIK